MVQYEFICYNMHVHYGVHPNSKEIRMSAVSSLHNAYSKENFQCIKGYLALLVLVHHLYLFTGFLSDTPLGHILYTLGHWAVVVFMFFSGYGLFISYLEKGKSYIFSFARRRLLPLYLTYVFFVAIYYIYNLINSIPMNIYTLLHSLTVGNTIVSFGWYFKLTVLLYIIFMVVGLLSKSSKTFLWSVTLILYCYVIAYFFLSWHKELYEPVILFLAGMHVAALEHKRKCLVSKKPVLFLFISLPSFAAYTIAYTLILYRHGNLLDTPCPIDFLYLGLMALSDLSLVIVVLSFTSICSERIPKLICNPVSSFCGTYSLEIYAIQGLVLSLFYTKIGNLVIFASVAAFVTIVISIPIHAFLKYSKQIIVGKIS